MTSQAPPSPDPKADSADNAAAVRGGLAAIVGRPNVGKSTLLNTLLGQKLAIATDRPGTTRTNILGVFQQGGNQIGFVDTPGILRPKSALHHVLQEQAETALSGLNVACLVVESNKRGAPHSEDGPIYERLKDANIPIVVACNKVDKRRDKSSLLPLLEHWGKQDGVTAAVPISALTGDNLEALISALSTHLGDTLPFPGDDVLTDRPVRFFAAELIREAIMEQVHAEVPYGVAVQLDRYLEEAGRVRIDATIIVEKDSHKGIVIGRAGSKLKAIGIAARQAIEAFIECPVVLKTWVKVHEGWTQDPRAAKAFSQETDR